MKIFLATVCLERNRWGSREPSFPVSEWLPRFAADGFDGVELWENHYLAAEPGEQARLAASAAPLAVFNTYAGFADADAEGRERVAAAIERLQAAAVKYNLGPKADALPEYRRNLLAWADRLPATCRLLCECHPGTVLEQPSAAAAFFADLDPERFGIIVHVDGGNRAPEPWLDAFGPRVRHLHLQLRGPETDPAVPANRERLDACYRAVASRGFAGSASLEFTRGIGKEEEMQKVYANALTDLAYCREVLS